MKTNDRLEVLKLKLQGKTPAQISTQTGLTMAEVFKHDSEIKRQMAKENTTDMGKLDPLALEAVTETVNQLLPYMERSTSKMLKASRGLKPLHDSMIESAELIHVLIQNAIYKELEADNVNITKVQKLSGMLNDSYKAFFNKDGIQVVNILNDMSPDEERTKTADIIKELKRERDILVDVIDVKDT